ncbi:putative mitochondrial protein [Sesamum alatum]|uniref:Mitochondrial protein n=1 Tax=Sesamum alatum TaxID=300844 RepID=A0AAE1YY60_9LAMI|nr:putative mitochondrial protein [Sesamum alatum]
MVAVPSKSQAIEDWPPPLSLTALRVFLGMTGYYRRFVRHYAAIARPLTDLLKRQAFNWTPTTATEFEALKLAMLQLPSVVPPRFFPTPTFLRTFVNRATIGKVAYELELSAGAKVHPIFHISLLKPYHGPITNDCVALPPEILAIASGR